MRPILAMLAVAGMLACADPDDTDTTADAALLGPDAADGPDAPGGTALFREGFDAPDGPAWPAGWGALGDVASATLESGRGRLVPEASGYTLGRMGRTLAGGGPVELDVRFTLAMTDMARQGVGFYVRQNGGYLGETTPAGGGYAVFVEGFAGHFIGVWRERDGVEEVLQRTGIAPLVDDATYVVHFRVMQESPTLSRLDAKVWPLGDAEPPDWMVTAVDDTPALQGTSGGIAVDAWNTVLGGGQPPPTPIFVDDIEIRAALPD